MNIECRSSDKTLQYSKLPVRNSTFSFFQKRMSSVEQMDIGLTIHLIYFLLAYNALNDLYFSLMGCLKVMASL
jgi:hypothetical protein